MLDDTWISKYNDNIKFDNTINLISRIKELADIIIVSELEKLGEKGIAPSHGDIIVALIKHEELTMTEIAKKINRKLYKEIIDIVVLIFFWDKYLDVKLYEL